MTYFGFGQEVATLTVSLFISGYCLGPLLWGPLSEDVTSQRYSSTVVYSICPLDRSSSRLFNSVPVQLGIDLRLSLPDLTPDCRLYCYRGSKLAAPYPKTPLPF
jgi:hypothetical protein